jgi:hypothetical protein
MTFIYISNFINFIWAYYLTTPLLVKRYALKAPTKA